MLPNYTASCGHVHFPVADTFLQNLLAELSDILINEIWNGNDTLATEVFKSIATFKQLQSGLFDGWSKRRMEITYDATDNHCLAMMEYNLFEFSRLKEKANVIALNQLLLDKEKNNISGFKDFRDQSLQYLKNPDVNNLKTEYYQTVATGQNASRYHQFKSEMHITEWVQWQTVGDSHVRKAHQALDGKIFNLKDPSGLTIWPPKDWGCRCEMVQYLGNPPKDSIYSNEQGLKTLDIAKGSKWDVNRGKIEQVFTGNDMYAKSIDLSADLGKMTFDKYGLKPFAEIKGNYPAIKLDSSITQKNAAELFIPEKGKDYMGFEDHLGRKLVMQKKVFDEHTTGDKYNKQNRHQLFPHVATVLKDPDELYFFEYKKGKFQTRYIKFFKDQAIVVNTDTGSSGLEVNTWFNMAAQDDINRKGYLIHQKKKP